MCNVRILFGEFLERLKDSRKVDSLAFVLLLFLQSFHQIDLKSTLSRDEFVHFIRSLRTWLIHISFRWPNRKRNSDLDARKNRVCLSSPLSLIHSIIRFQIYDEQSHQLFIQGHLDDILNIVSDTTGRIAHRMSFHSSFISESNNIENAQSATLSMEAVTALSFIFEGTFHESLRKVIPLHTIIQNSSIQHEIGIVRMEIISLIDSLDSLWLE